MPLLSATFLFKTLDTFVPTYCDVDLEVMKIAIMCLFYTIENRTGEILPPSQSEHVAGNYSFPGTACSSLLLGEINRYLETIQSLVNAFIYFGISPQQMSDLN